MNRLKVILGAALLAALLVPAGAAFAQPDTGAANFSRYVAVGDSLTAGFASGGLVRTVQVNSYPALIHRQATGGAGGFEQPLVSEPGITPLLRLQSLVPLSIAPRPGTGAPVNLNLPRPYNNLAVPGANARDVRFTTSGGLHDLILRNPAFGNTTALQQAVSLQPTFVTIWIGNNDALGAATSGLVIDDVTLTTAARFEADFRAIVSTLAATGAELAIANIPNVTTIPFVTTLPPVLVNPATQQPVLIGGQPVRLIGPNGLLAPNDFVLLSAQAELAQGRGIPTAAGGSGQPLSDRAVLSAQEAAAISARVNQFNTIIATVAREVGAAFVDANAVLTEAATEGIDIGGITFTESFLTGGIFSYDGVHPTAFGYAFIANLFIDAINEQFDGEIPLVDLTPFMFGPEASAGTLTAEQAAGATFTPAALKNLFWALGVPDGGEVSSQPPGGGRQKPGKPGRGRGGRKPRGNG